MRKQHFNRDRIALILVTIGLVQSYAWMAALTGLAFRDWSENLDRITEKAGEGVAGWFVVSIDLTIWIMAGCIIFIIMKMIWPNLLWKENEKTD